MSKILSQREWDAVSCAAVPVDEPFPTATVIDARMKLSDHDAALRAENARLSRIEAAARELFRALDYVVPAWRDETCVIGGDEVNRAWCSLESALSAPPEEK